MASDVSTGVDRVEVAAAGKVKPAGSELFDGAVWVGMVVGGKVMATASELSDGVVRVGVAVEGKLNAADAERQGVSPEVVGADGAVDVNANAVKIEEVSTKMVKRDIKAEWEVQTSCSEREEMLNGTFRAEVAVQEDFKKQQNNHWEVRPFNKCHNPIICAIGQADKLIRKNRQKFKSMYRKQNWQNVTYISFNKFIIYWFL